MGKEYVAADPHLDPGAWETCGHGKLPRKLGSKRRRTPRSHVEEVVEKWEGMGGYASGEIH